MVPYADRGKEKGYYTATYIIKLVCLQTSENFAVNTCRCRKSGTVSRSCSKRPQVAKKGTCLFKGTSSFRMAGSAIWKLMIREFCGHFRFRGAQLSRNRVQMVFGIRPVKEITVFFKATDSAYTEVQRVLQIMIPEIRLT